MPPFQYTVPDEPYAGTIGDIILRKGDILARGAEAAAQPQAQAVAQNGQVWGGMLSRMGQSLGAIPQEMQQDRVFAQEQQLRTMQLKQATQQMADSDQARQFDNTFGQALTSTPRIKGSYGEQLYDAPTIMAAAAKNGASGTQLAQMTQTLAGLNDHLTKAQGDRIGAVQQGAQQVLRAGSPLSLVQSFISSHGAGPNGDHFFDADTETKLNDFVAQNPDAAGKVMEGFAGAPKIGWGKPGDQAFNETTGQPIAGMKVGEKPPDTAGGFAKVIGDPTSTPEQIASAKKSLDALRDPSNDSLPTQALRAKAEGRMDDFNRIISVAQSMAEANRDQVTQAQLRDLRNLSMAEARARRENDDPASPKNQAKFEQEYRTLLRSTISSRSGGLGMEDQKVNQTLHLLALFDQNKDAKGNYTISKMMLPEVAMGLARLISPTGVPTDAVVRDLEGKTAASDWAGVLTYFTGKPVTGNTQDILKSFYDSILRQGVKAQENRQGYFDQLKFMAPTDLNEERRTRMESGLGLNSIPFYDGILFPSKEKMDIYKKAKGVE